MGLSGIAGASHGLRYYLDLVPGGHLITQQIYAHKALAVFGVIALEEVGIPVPLPGDAFIAFAGHLVARRALDPVSAFLAVVLGAMIGSSVLYWLARIYGQPFVKRYGPYMHVKQKRIDRLERWFKRWGPLAVVIGRHIPGLRIVLSLCAGLFGVSYPVFVSSVALSASLWAGMFLVIGFYLSGQIGPYMDITPLHLLPSTIVISSSIIYALIIKRRATRAEALADAPLALNDAPLVVSSRAPF
ncbi:MAG: DedA family protein [Candidatus Dormibacteraeota bacterium]|nr:DedA family protein [Candidatus Dormibacteraeota bacterium]